MFKDRDGRVRHYKGLDEEIPKERPEGVWEPARGGGGGRETGSVALGG